MDQLTSRSGAASPMTVVESTMNGECRPANQVDQPPRVGGHPVPAQSHVLVRPGQQEVPGVERRSHFRVQIEDSQRDAAPAGGGDKAVHLDRTIAAQESTS
jgi:hypothetical protein